MMKTIIRVLNTILSAGKHAVAIGEVAFVASVLIFTHIKDIYGGNNVQLEQLDKSAYTVVSGSPKYQRLSCDDLYGEIHDITLSLSSVLSWRPQDLRIVFVRGSDWLFPSQAITFDSYAQVDRTFHFDPPVDVYTLCSWNRRVYFFVQRVGDIISAPHLHGSPDSNAYRDYIFDCRVGIHDSYPPEYFSNCYGGANDLYFIINPNENANLPPQLDTIGNQSIVEGETLEITLTAVDPEGDSLSFSADNLPPGATFNSTLALFYWTPNYNQAGNYTDIEFSVADDGNPIEVDVMLVSITVDNVNRAPAFDLIGPHETLEDELLVFSVSAYDPDGDNVQINALELPIGASFDTATKVFSWTPDYYQEGIYVVTFIATDDGIPQESEQINVTITVGDSPTPIEQADAIIETILFYKLSKAITNSYMANIKKVEKFIVEGKLNPAINQLNALLNKLDIDFSSGEISQTVYDDLVLRITHLIDDINL
jgi:hypothetical protein